MWGDCVPPDRQQLRALARSGAAGGQYRTILRPSFSTNPTLSGRRSNQDNLEPLSLERAQLILLGGVEAVVPQINQT
mgnify:CR=1 FL=1